VARIRTIKPEFFTSEDIVGLSPLARLLYIALWCEADREGRLIWKPRTFKLRYLPADNCDAAVLAQELIDQGLVVLYGDGLAFIPTFGDHQHLNPREAASLLTPPDASATRRSRVRDASARVPDAQGGREGKGREGKKEPPIPPSGGLLDDETKPAKRSRKGEAMTYAQFVEACKADGEKLIPSDHAVFAFAQDTGLPVEFIKIAWREFARQYRNTRKTQAGKRGWRQKFENCVRRNWFKLWWTPGEGQCELTTTGRLLQKELDAEAERKAAENQPEQAA
jgi:hypothetical protein